MTGICGWAAWGSGPFAPDLLARMAKGLPAADFDQSAETETAGCGLALRSWSTAPKLYHDDDLLVAITGYPRWRSDELTAQSRSRGAAQTLAELYRRKGVRLFDDLLGAFSFAVLDRKSRATLLAIDRSGIEPLCYAIGGDGTLVFGSTTDSVRAHHNVDGGVRLQSIFDFFYFVDRIPAPYTIYEAQRKLPPAHYLLFKDGRPEERAYWQVPYRDGGSRSFGSLAEELHERLRVAVARALEGENGDRVGAYLSGGLDSSSMLGMLAQVSPHSPRTFTIGFREAAYDESHYAQIAASHFDADHTVFVMEPRHTFESAPTILRCYDEPFANSSALPAYYCALTARQAGVETMLAGDGGDELFAGNSRYVKDRVFELYGRLPSLLRRGLLEPAADRMAGGGRLGFLRRARNYERLARMSVPARMIDDNVYRMLDRGDIFEEDFLSEIDPAAPVALAEEIYRSAPGQSKIQKMMYLDLRLTIADSDLRKVSRMCELAGVRVRYPFLDDDLVGFSAAIPPDLLLRGGRLRDFYKRAMAEFLPQEILEKPKHGFGLPYLDHVSGYAPLRDYFADSLGALKRRGYFKPAFIDRMQGHLKDPSQGWYHGIAWDFVALEHWFQSRLD